jgi:hypothetical protein
MKCIKGERQGVSPPMFFVVRIDTYFSVVLAAKNAKIAKRSAASIKCDFLCGLCALCGYVSPLAFAAKRVKPRWGLDRNSSQPGVRRVAATPGFV